MASLAKTRNQNLPQQPYILLRVVYGALSPLDQIAARALEKCGLVRIVDEQEENSPG
jgi:hypothetical protein